MGNWPRSANGRARVDARNPEAFAVCDRCSFRYNHVDLSWQMEFAGSSLQNMRILVCDRCLDEPQQQLRSYAVPPDPIPIRDPRPDFSEMITSFTPYLTDEAGNLVTDEFGHPIVVVQQTAPGGPSAMPPPNVGSLIPLRDDSGNIIIGDDGLPFMVDA